MNAGDTCRCVAIETETETASERASEWNRGSRWRGATDPTNCGVKPASPLFGITRQGPDLFSYLQPVILCTFCGQDAGCFMSRAMPVMHSLDRACAVTTLFSPPADLGSHHLPCQPIRDAGKRDEARTVTSCCKVGGETKNAEAAVEASLGRLSGNCCLWRWQTGVSGHDRLCYVSSQIQAPVRVSPVSIAAMTSSINQPTKPAAQGTTENVLPVRDSGKANSLAHTTSFHTLCI